MKEVTNANIAFIVSSIFASFVVLFIEIIMSKSNSPLDIDGTDNGLSLLDLRLQHDGMKHGVDICLLPYEIGRRIDEAYQEAGFASMVSTSVGALGMISYGVDDQGKRVSFFDTWWRE